MASTTRSASSGTARCPWSCSSTSAAISTTGIPRSPTRTTNVVEFYYPEEIVLFEREFIEAQQAAYVETAIEDNEICERLDAGRRALYEQGLDDAGPYQSPMEDAEVHFHEWLHRKLGK